jgi:hypothetical protein
MEGCENSMDPGTPEAPKSILNTGALKLQSSWAWEKVEVNASTRVMSSDRKGMLLIFVIYHPVRKVLFKVIQFTTVVNPFPDIWLHGMISGIIHIT